MKLSKFQSGWFWLSVLAILWSCTDETFTPIVDIHPDFIHLVDSFSLEAARHGRNIRIDNLILRYDPQLESDLCGQCNSLAGTSSTLQKEVHIATNNHCWEHPQELEALIFHELGHCLLGRSHISDTLPNGDPKSLMVAGDLTVFAPCRYVFGSVDCNNLHKRAYYIQELFDPNTPVPDWAK